MRTCGKILRSIFQFFRIEFIYLIQEKKAGKQKYKKSIPKHASEHMNKFKPNNFEKSGFDSLFNIVTGIPFNPYIAKKRKYARGEKPEFKKPFT